MARKEGEKAGKILFIKLRPEKYSINEEKEKHFWAAHWTKEDDKAVTLHHIKLNDLSALTSMV